MWPRVLGGGGRGKGRWAVEGIWHKVDRVRRGWRGIKGARRIVQQ